MVYDQFFPKVLDFMDYADITVDIGYFYFGIVLDCLSPWGEFSLPHW